MFVSEIFGFINLIFVIKKRIIMNIYPQIIVNIDIMGKSLQFIFKNYKCLYFERSFSETCFHYHVHLKGPDGGKYV